MKKTVKPISYAKPQFTDEDDSPEVNEEWLAGATIYDPPRRLENPRVVILGLTDGVVRARLEHGGVRAGAGRKPLDHVSMRLSLRPETRRRIEAIAKRKGMTLSAVVDEAFAR